MQIPTSFHGDFQVMRLSAAAGKLPPGAVLDGGWNETSDEGIYGRWRIKHGDYYGDLMVFSWDFMVVYRWFTY